MYFQFLPNLGHELGIIICYQVEKQSMFINNWFQLNPRYCEKLNVEFKNIENEALLNIYLFQKAITGYSNSNLFLLLISFFHISLFYHHEKANLAFIKVNLD
jgi:hypothetical protein